MDRYYVLNISSPIMKCLHCESFVYHDISCQTSLMQALLSTSSGCVYTIRDPSVQDQSVDDGEIVWLLIIARSIIGDIQSRIFHQMLHAWHLISVWINTPKRYLGMFFDSTSQKLHCAGEDTSRSSRWGENDNKAQNSRSLMICEQKQKLLQRKLKQNIK